MKSCLFFLWVAPLLAYPANDDPVARFLQTRAPDFEWTAWGDSYASAVGTGNYVNGRRCLRKLPWGACFSLIWLVRRLSSVSGTLRIWDSLVPPKPFPWSLAY